MILGIDPGFAIVGFAVINEDNNKHQLIDCGVIRTQSNLLLAQRLYIIEEAIQEVIKTWDIKIAAVEEIFFANNKKTAIDTAHARGVILKNLFSANIPIVEYTPPQIKKTVTGFGKATKKDIQAVIKRFFDLKQTIVQDDACDAMAVALCCKYSNKLLQYV